MYRSSRWGVLTPDAFIPIAERSDLIIDLDRWVLDTAVGLFARRRGPLDELSIAVGPHRRNLVLPDSLRRRDITTARMAAGRLEVTFEVAGDV